jgi:hypothetical protein
MKAALEAWGANSDGREMFAHACNVGLEGVVSKVCDSAYASGRGNNWVKKTCAERETLTIAGFALDEGKWDGIYVGRAWGDDLIYAGKVDHGFDKASAVDLQQRLKPLIRKTQPDSKRIAHKGKRSHNPGRGPPGRGGGTTRPGEGKPRRRAGNGFRTMSDRRCDALAARHSFLRFRPRPQLQRGPGCFRADP